MLPWKAELVLQMEDSSNVLYAQQEVPATPGNTAIGDLLSPQMAKAPHISHQTQGFRRHGSVHQAWANRSDSAAPNRSMWRPTPETLGAGQPPTGSRPVTPAVGGQCAQGVRVSSEF